MNWTGYTVKELRKTEGDKSPNMIAVVNWPPDPKENRTPARGYVLEKDPGDIMRIYGSLENAIHYFLYEVERIPKKDELYRLIIISGRIEKKMPEQDLFIYPFVKATHNSIRTKTIGYLVKNSEISNWPVQQGDGHQIILGDEAKYRRQCESLNQYFNAFPPIWGLELGLEIPLIIPKKS